VNEGPRKHNISTSRIHIIMMNSIYILQLAEHVRSGENIYKVGFTELQPRKLLQRCPKGSELNFFFAIPGVPEAKILKGLKAQFEQRHDCGPEYFQGDFHFMVDCIMSLAIHSSRTLEGL